MAEASIEGSPVEEAVVLAPPERTEEVVTYTSLFTTELVLTALFTIDLEREETML